MITQAGAGSALTIIQSFDFLQFPYLSCEVQWLQQLYAPRNLPLIQYARLKQLRSKYFNYTGPVAIKPIPLHVILGEFGYLAALNQIEIEALYRKLAYFFSYVSKNESFISFEAALSAEQSVCQSKFERDGAVYQNVFKAIEFNINNGSKVLFGSKLTDANAETVSSFGFSILKLLLEPEVSNNFLIVLALKSSPTLSNKLSTIAYEPVKSNTNLIAVVLQYLIDIKIT